MTLELNYFLPFLHFSSSLLANSRVERCRTDDLMPSVPIILLPSSKPCSSSRAEGHRLSSAR